VGNRFAQPAGQRERAAELVVRVGVVGVERERALIVVDRVVELSELGERDARADQRLDVARLRNRDLTVALERGVRPVEGRVGDLRDVEPDGDAIAQIAAIGERRRRKERLNMREPSLPRRRRTKV
jgi:hypothetical protein